MSVVQMESLQLQQPAGRASNEALNLRKGKKEEE
jgi:hypothetical protein